MVKINKQIAHPLYLLHIILLLSSIEMNAKSYNNDSLKLSWYNTNENDKKINLGLTIIDYYIQIDSYDSAQVWLQKISAYNNKNKINTQQYLLTIRQAEVYYYSGLQQLGLDKAQIALQLAKQLKDSTLIADAHNFCGLFYANRHNNQLAIQHFDSAISYIPTIINNKDLYKYCSNLHHILGNLSEAYFNESKLDTALFYAQKSLEASQKNSDYRSTALANIMIGAIYNKSAKANEAISVLNKGLAIAQQHEIWDAALLAYSGLAKAYANKNEATSMYANIDSGHQLIDSNGQINALYQKLFLTELDNTLNSHHDVDVRYKVKDNLLQLQQHNLLKYEEQIGFILKESLKNETELMSLQIAEAKQKEKNAYLSIAIIVMLALVLIIILLYLRYIQKQKIKVAEFRHKVSRDLHDDIGATLSSLQIYATIALKTMHQQPEKAKEVITKILQSSEDVMNNMDDIVWSMQDNYQDQTPLSAKIKNYGANMLHDKNIAVYYEIDPTIDEQIQSMLHKKNIWLIIKEAINNIAKYSQATKAIIVLYQKNNTIYFKISDNGIGYDIDKKANGNGLKNMTTRIKELNGTINFLSEPNNGFSIEGNFKNV